MPFDEPLYSHLGSLSNFTPDIHFNPLPDFGDRPTHFRETLLVNKSASFPSWLQNFFADCPLHEFRIIILF